MTDLWDHENPVTDYDIDVPAWIDQDISPCDVAAIIQGGCDSGAYMPAVIYYQAMKTMAEFGDDIFEFIQEYDDELPKPNNSISWSGLACFYLSYAVEIWVSSVEQELTDAIEESNRN